MKKSMFLSLFSLVIIFLLLGCGNDDDTELINPEDAIDESEFDVEIHVEEDNFIYATITYLGEEDEIIISHASSIFYFNLYEVDGEAEYGGALDASLVTTTLLSNEPHKVYYNQIPLEEVESGKYKVEAVADFFIEDQRELSFEISESTIIEIDN